MKKISLVFVLMFGLFQIVYSQTNLKWVMDDEEANLIDFSVPDGNALLVFDSPVDLEFDSSIEHIEQPKRNNGKYYLLVSKGPQAISLIYNSIYNINFGQLMDPNTLPPLKNKEIKYFRVSVAQKLEIFNITEQELANGNIGIPIGKNVSDALVVLKIFPPNMEVSVSEKNDNITKLSNDKSENYSSVNVFLTAPGTHELEVFQSEIGSTTIQIRNLETKETRFYLVRKPVTLDDYNINNNAESSIQKYKGYWGGNLADERVFLNIKEISNGKTNGQIYLNGIYHDFSGYVKVKSDNEFYVTADISASEFNNEKATIDFFIKMGVGSGIFISSNADVKDMNILKVAKIPDELPLADIRKFKKLQSKLLGKWKNTKDSHIINIDIKKMDIQGGISGKIFFSDHTQCIFKGEYKVKSDIPNFILNISEECNKYAGVLIYKYSYGKLSGMFTSNNGSIMELGSFLKQ